MNPASTDLPAIPDHQLVRRIGRGSYGEVWLARNVMGSFRAVKVVYRASFDSDRPYERELSGLEKFEPVSRTHPGLVSILHLGKNHDAQYFYCIMEVADDLANGPAIDPDTYQPRTLAAELSSRGRLPLAECVELGMALSAGIQHLHARGLVHRDIKPSNIIFVQGLPKFADIGLVTRVGTKATFVGTEGYIPPEGPGSVPADIFSLGKVLYEAAMGKSQEQFPELPTRLRELPEGEGLMRLNAVILKACDPHPSKRFRSAEDLYRALSNLRDSYPSHRPEEGTAAKPGLGLNAIILVPASCAPELSLARTLADRLNAEGFRASVDEQADLTVDWARGLEQAIRKANLIIPVIPPTPAGSISTMLAYTFEVARQCSHHSRQKPILLPVVRDLQAPAAPFLALFPEAQPPFQASPSVPADEVAAEIVRHLSLKS